MDENEPEVTTESQTAADIDNRDPRFIHAEGARVDFEDVIAEHGGVHSLGFMWKISYHTFTQTKLWIYRLFTLILGFPLSLLWGLQFALLSFLHIWIVVPCLKTIQFNFYCLLRPLFQLIRVCLLPLFKNTVCCGAAVKQKHHIWVYNHIPSLSLLPLLFHYLSFIFIFRLFLESGRRTMDENEPAITIESQTMADIDNRDPKEIHEEGARVDFEDVIAEPDGLHSLDRVWKASHRTFTETKLWIYRFFTLILGVPLSLLWGLLFASLSFVHIWIVVPCLRALQFNFYCLLRPLLKLIRVCFRPLFKVTGKLISKVKIVIRKES